MALSHAPRKGIRAVVLNRQSTRHMTLNAATNPRIHLLNTTLEHDTGPLLPATSQTRERVDLPCTAPDLSLH